MKEAKVIAMTCTHAALKRKDLVELAFKVRGREEGRERENRRLGKGGGYGERKKEW